MVGNDISDGPGSPPAARSMAPGRCVEGDRQRAPPARCGARMGRGATLDGAEAADLGNELEHVAAGRGEELPQLGPRVW